MDDVDISNGDNKRVTTLKQAYNYDKIEVSFESMEAPLNCDSLGGLRKERNKLNKKH
jgi:hypothetical protein